jgi:biopolymer transport protein ExbB
MIELFDMGKEMMYPLLACSILTLAAIIDRGYAFLVYWKTDTRALRSRVLDLLRQNKVSEAAHLCADTSGPVSAVLLAGLQSYSKHKPLHERVESLMSVMREHMDDYAEHALAAVRKRLIVLQTVVLIAPLLGMTGTVTGMIRGFDRIAAAGQLDASLVAGGIKEALVTTATGLVIAVFAAVPYMVFRSATERVDLEVEEASSELLDYVATVVETSNANKDAA